MIAFFQYYGFWIVLIALFILMMLMRRGHGRHGMGGCCGMGGMEHDHQDRAAYHHHSSAEPKSDDERPGVIPYAGDEYPDRSRSSQQEQLQVRESPAEYTESNDDKPFVTTQQFREQ